MIENVFNKRHVVNEATFYDFELDGKRICFHSCSNIYVQTRKKNQSYKTIFSAKAKDFHKAVFHYNCLNVHSGFSKRLFCPTLNKKVLARCITT